jgi:hypothetical protein
MFFQSYMSSVAIVTVILLMEICYSVLSSIRGGHDSRIWTVPTSRLPQLEAIVSSGGFYVIGITQIQQREGSKNGGDCQQIT